MVLRYLPTWVCLSGFLAAAAPRARAQAAPAADSTQPTPPLLLKAGLRLTHLHFAHDSKSWQFLLPLSLGAEYRVAPRISLYTQAEADMQASRTTSRRQSQPMVPDAGLSLGARYYYGHARRQSAAGPAPEFGKYLAFEGAADWQQLTTRSARSSRRSNAPAVLTPSCYALWGVQNRLHPHLLYDLSAGLGVLAPAHYYNFEHVGPAAHWDVDAQVNVRLFFGD